MSARVSLMFGALLIVQGCASSGKTIPEATADAGFVDKAELISISGYEGTEDGKGHYPRLSALGAPPKRIALLSFYVIPNATERARGGALWGTESNLFG